MQRFPSFHRNSSSTGIPTAREYLSDILNKHYSATATATAGAQPERSEKGQRQRKSTGGALSLNLRKGNKKMPSSKGNPTDPELREQVKEEVKAEEKGGGAGSWSAWKAGEMARRYEAQGGDYEDTGNNKNKAQKGAPEKK